MEPLAPPVKAKSASIALAAVVTYDALEEFKILKFSFELFHGPGFEWFLRCDAQTASELSSDPAVHCTVFTDGTVRKWTTTDPQFLSVVVQKMNSMEDAWNNGNWDAVAFLDADLLITGPVMDRLSKIEGELLLTPHYWNSPRAYCDFMLYGYYNSGFVMTRSRQFHSWWRDAFVSDPSKFTDQECLNDARARFEVVNLGPEANIGNWRNPAGTDGVTFPPIPDDCLFLHVHLFQPNSAPSALISGSFCKQRDAFTGEKASAELFTPSQTVQKMFAVHCLEFLRTSARQEHRVLFREIVRRDPLELYRSLIPPEDDLPEEKEYQIGHLTIVAPVENPLDEYKAEHRLYDSFLPLLAELCEDGNWIVDVGANVGDTLAAVIQNNQAQVLSIEGHPEYFAYLERNVNVFAEPIRQRAKVLLSLVGTGAFSGELTKEKGSAKLSVAPGNCRRAESLDGLIADSAILLESIFLLKTDTDGFDGDVLLSAEDSLKKGSALVFFENQPETGAQLAAFHSAYRLLADSGYTHFWIFDNYGNLMLEDVPASVLPVLSRYLEMQNREGSTRAIYYFDVLAAKPQQVEIANRAVQKHVEFSYSRCLG